MNQSDCPCADQLRAYVLGKLPEDLAEQVERHLQVCPTCEAAADSFDTEVDSLIAQIREPSSNDPFLAEPQCDAAVAKAKLLAGKVRSEEKPPEDPVSTPPTELGCLGEYQLLARLRKGGMGRVYKAQQVRLKKTVALKVLPKERTTDPRLVARFAREMEAIGQLEHPNIVLAYDAREIDRTRVLVMEYVDGKDLAEIVENAGRLRIADACEIVRQTALGLQYACERGLVHRDIKPSNLMLSRRGQVKILDLGLALLSPDQLKDDELTSPGSAMGTADYMAPEQVSDAHSVDIRADIYSLGCTLYKLLTGRAPFGGPQYKSNAEKLVGHLKETPQPVRELRADVPAELAAAIARMMAKSPIERFASPAEVAEAMVRFAVGCDLVRVSAEASASEERTVTVERATSATDPLASSAVVDTDASGPAIKLERRNDMLAPEPSRVKPWFATPRIRWIAVTVVAFFAVVCFGILFKLQTRNGTLTVEMDDPEAIVQVLSETNEVVIERKGEKGSLTIGVAPGNWRLCLKKNGDVNFTEDFVLAAGGKATIKVPFAENATTPSWRPEQQAIDDMKARTQQENCAKRLGVPIEITNSIRMRLVLIPPGQFMMGSTNQSINEELRLRRDEIPWAYWKNRLPSELPQHQVRITKPFRLGVTEVTQEEYQHVIGSNPSKFQGDPKRPVERVSWDDAVEFCRRLSELPEEKAAGRRYALPTEAQWEYACRASSTVAIQSAADPLARAQEENKLSEYGWFSLNSGAHTYPVGQKQANGFGLNDMYGNVWEWCTDSYAPDYYKKSPVDDPGGPATGLDRVSRGGSWYHPPYACRLTTRNYGIVTGISEHVGFRVAQFPAEK